MGAVLMLLFSVTAAAQYRLLCEYVGVAHADEQEKGQEQEQEQEQEDAVAAQKRIERNFEEADTDHNGKVGAAELHCFAERALQRSLSNAERYTLQLFLDCSCNGYISKEDWTKQFLHYNQVRFL